MHLTIRTARGGARPDAVAALVFSDDQTVPAALKAVDRRCVGEVARALKRPEIGRKPGELATVYPVSGAGRLMIVGLGEKKDFDVGCVRQAGAAIARAAAEAELSRIQIETKTIGALLGDGAIGQALAEGLVLGGHRFEQFKGSASDPAKKGTLSVLVDGPLAKGFRRGLVVAEAANVARTLAATPPNEANPAGIVKHARALARKQKLNCRVIDAKAAQKLGMGGLLAVGAGGSSPPSLICLEHKPARQAKKPPLLLVGKTITFDTGGYSLKPTTGIVRMKYDKCGGMAVLGAMQAIAALKIPRRVVGVLAVAENMVDTKAYRPDDIITFCNGVTCEVTNTDAEGRLVLADALAYATQHYKPEAVIDLATLTGGVVTALGDYCAGAFCNDDQLFEQLTEAAEASGEKLWRLPIWDDHRKQMVSDDADLANSAGGRKAHPIQGAAFLSHFVGEDAPKQMPTLPWCHIDIAGMADLDNDHPLTGKGPTGFGVRLLVEAVENWGS
ncbi:MAG: leucyl aminopeptidase [Phycisphaeraceae bacterium]|nr:leucyl aminopeptidase [Phycisphaeraceae bacterium]